MSKRKVSQLLVLVTLDANFDEYKEPMKKAEHAFASAVMGGSFIHEVEVFAYNVAEYDDETGEVSSTFEKRVAAVKEVLSKKVDEDFNGDCG